MNAQVVIIIGLPGSGKTTLSQKFIDDGYIIFDDFVNTFYNGDLINKIISGSPLRKFCINDPRLCQFDIFNKHITIIEKYVNRSNIYLILYENDPKTCLVNIQNRKDNRKGITNTINNYSKFYYIDNYKTWNHEIIKVYYAPEY
ncbi:mg971 protein [Tupanvirus deep ocean]|uniref:Mg971 protein n=2 Tax=Tupanvirus TaxID=2094720 RepID=A0AC62A6W1_9VIRU|nr:mg971 protein [Tupanvirus deep ocean]QKU33435.1 mg971 protein [Tupanvirus deep ocean]